MRIPKLRGFKNRFKIDYEVVNIGAIAAAAERGAFEGGEMPGAATKPKKSAPVTVNQELLRAVGLVRTLKKPLKILGNGELSTALFVVADAFTKSAVSKIEAAGGTISVLEVPAEELTALGLDAAPAAKTAPEPKATRTTEPKATAVEAPARKSSSRKAAVEASPSTEAPGDPESESGDDATAEAETATTATSDEDSASAEAATEPTPEVDTPNDGENA
jgi:hypothetical protein